MHDFFFLREFILVHIAIFKDTFQWVLVTLLEESKVVTFFAEAIVQIIAKIAGNDIAFDLIAQIEASQRKADFQTGS